MVLQVGISRLRGERVYQLSSDLPAMTFWAVVVTRCVRRRNRALRQIRAVPVTPPLASPLSIFSSPQHLRRFSLTRMAKLILARTPRTPLTYLPLAPPGGSQRGADVISHLRSRDASAAFAGPRRSAEDVRSTRRHYSQGDTP